MLTFYWLNFLLLFFESFQIRFRKKFCFQDFPSLWIFFWRLFLHQKNIIHHFPQIIQLVGRRLGLSDKGHFSLMNHIKTGGPRRVAGLKRVFFHQITKHTSLVVVFLCESGCYPFSFLLRLVSGYSKSFSYRPYIGGMSFANVDGEDLTALLVLAVELLEIREESPEWISGVASREHDNGFWPRDELLEGKENTAL